MKKVNCNTRINSSVYEEAKKCAKIYNLNMNVFVELAMQCLLMYFNEKGAMVEDGQLCRLGK